MRNLETVIFGCLFFVGESITLANSRKPAFYSRYRKSRLVLDPLIPRSFVPLLMEILGQALDPTSRTGTCKKLLLFSIYAAFHTRTLL